MAVLSSKDVTQKICVTRIFCKWQCLHTEHLTNLVTDLYNRNVELLHAGLSKDREGLTWFVAFCPGRYWSTGALGRTTEHRLSRRRVSPPLRDTRRHRDGNSGLVLTIKGNTCFQHSTNHGTWNIHASKFAIIYLDTKLGFSVWGRIRYCQYDERRQGHLKYFCTVHIYKSNELSILQV